jgi:F-type H+-transporting ATPase subunit alpha
MVRKKKEQELNNLVSSLMAANVVNVKPEQFGRVVSLDRNTLTLIGLEDVFLGEVISSGDLRAYIVELAPGFVRAWRLGNQQVKIGDEFIRTNESLSLVVNENFLGSMVDGFGNGKLPSFIPNDKGVRQELFPEKTHLLGHQPIEEQCETGVNVVDFLLPIGYGQRQLILGKKKSGKTSLALTALKNQCKKGTIGIYVAIGQQRNKTLEIRNRLLLDGIENFIIVEAGLESSAAERYFAPYTATAIGEYFRDRGKKVLIVFDDLGAQAKAYREIALESGAMPGKMAYPADSFFIHSSLLERAYFDRSGGSITMLPIVATDADEIAGYIPTNIVSITDGQILMNSQLKNSNYGMLINLGKSVSRIGNSVLPKKIKKLISGMKIQQICYLEKLLEVSLRSSVDQRKSLAQRTFELLEQEPYEAYSRWQQYLILCYLDTCKTQEDLLEIPLQRIKDALLNSKKYSKAFSDKTGKIVRAFLKELEGEYVEI